MTSAPEDALASLPTSVFRRLDPAGLRAELWAWLAQSPADPRRLWSSCPRGDWLAWWLAAMGADPRLLVRACCECLRLAEGGAPACLDAPRRVVLAASAWSEDRPGEPFAVPLAEVESLVAETSATGALRTLLLGFVWLGRLLGSPPSDADSPERREDAATEAYLSVWHAAAALSSEVNPHEVPGSAWWARCLEAALGRFAEVIRACVDFDELPLAGPGGERFL